MKNKAMGKNKCTRIIVKQERDRKNKCLQNNNFHTIWNQYLSVATLDISGINSLVISDNSHRGKTNRTDSGGARL